MTLNRPVRAPRQHPPEIPEPGLQLIATSARSTRHAGIVRAGVGLEFSPSELGMRDNNHTRRPGALAAGLTPARLPWFVSQPQFRSRTPSIGWWWIPVGHQHPVYLGHNHIVAEVQLRSLLDAQGASLGA